MAKAAKTDQTSDSSKELSVSKDPARDAALEAAIKSVTEILTDESLTAEGVCLRIVNQVREMQFSAPGSSAQIAGLLKSFGNAARQLRLNNDPRSLIAEAVKLQQRAVVLARPERGPSPGTLSDEQNRGLALAGWGGEEREWLVIELRRLGGRVITSYDATGVKLAGGGEIARAWLRSVNGPTSEYPALREKFLASLPKIPTMDSHTLEAKES